MKNLKYIIYFFTLALVFSCGEDDVDSITNDGTFTDSRHVFVGFTDANNNFTATESDAVTYTISMNEPLTSDAVITLQMVSSDGSVEATYDNTVTIPAGQTSVDVTVTMADDGDADDGLETYTLTITDVQYTLTSTVYLTLGDTSRTISVLDLLETIAGDVTITLTWTDGGRDMDLFLVTGMQDLGGTVVDSSAGVTTTEVVTFPSTAAEDADFSVWTQEWPSFSGGPVDLTLTVDFPDAQQKVYNITVTQNSWLLGIRKTTIGTTLAYTLTQY